MIPANVFKTILSIELSSTLRIVPLMLCVSRVVYLARDIPAFVMYCVYGEFRSSLLIELESTNSMIFQAVRRAVNVPVPYVYLNICPMRHSVMQIP